MISCKIATSYIVKDFYTCRYLIHICILVFAHIVIFHASELLAQEGPNQTVIISANGQLKKISSQENRSIINLGYPLIYGEFGNILATISSRGLKIINIDTEEILKESHKALGNPLYRLEGPVRYIAFDDKGENLYYLTYGEGGVLQEVLLRRFSIDDEVITTLKVLGCVR